MTARTKKHNATNMRSRSFHDSRIEKYKQRYIPEVETPKEWKEATLTNLSKFIKAYYQGNLQGSAVINIDKGIRITFSGQGRQKITKGSFLYSKKAALVLILKELLELAEFNNFGQRKRNDPGALMGYLNFKVKCRIDGKLETVRIACMMYHADRIYFNHEVNIKKGCKPCRRTVCIS